MTCEDFNTLLNMSEVRDVLDAEYIALLKHICSCEKCLAMCQASMDSATPEERADATIFFMTQWQRIRQNAKIDPEL